MSETQDAKAEEGKVVAVKVKAGRCPFCDRPGGILHDGDRCRYCGRLGTHRAMMGGRQPWRRQA